MHQPSAVPCFSPAFRSLHASHFPRDLRGMQALRISQRCKRLHWPGSTLSPPLEADRLASEARTTRSAPRAASLSKYSRRIGLQHKPRNKLEAPNQTNRRLFSYNLQLVHDTHAFTAATRPL